MVRPSASDLDDQLKKQELDSDGSEAASGSNPVSGEDSTADVDTMVADVIGNEPDEEEDGFNIGEEINKDEHDIRDKEINDYTEEQDEETETEVTARKDKQSEDAATNDPYDTYGEDDDLDEASEE